MARARRERRERGSGSIVRRGDRYYLLLKVGERSFQRLITDDDGNRVTSTEAARSRAPALADSIRKEATRNLSGEPIERLAEVYRRYLPTYSKRKGQPHVDSTGRSPIAPRTLASNLNCIGAFVAWLKANHPEVRTVEGVGRQHAAGYLASLADRKPGTFNRHLMALRHVFNVVPVGGNAFACVTQKSKAEVDRAAVGKRAFTIEELATMQTRAIGWVRPAMFIGYHSGLRLGDVVTLRWSEIDADGYITRAQRKSSKVSPLYCPEILPELAAWRSAQGDGAGEYVFPEQASAYLGMGRKVDQTLPDKQFQRFLVKTCKFATHDDAGNVVLGFHSLRASNATYTRRAGATIGDVQKRLAHSDVSTTNGYVQLTADDQRRELRETHRPLLLPGAATEAQRSELQDRDRLAALARTLPIAGVRTLLAATVKGAAQ